MKNVIAVALLTLSTTAAAWTHQAQPNNVYQGPHFNPPPSNLSTFGTGGFQTTTGNIGGQDVNLNTFGSQGFQTTTGRIGDQNINCQTFGSPGFQTTTCN